MYIKISSHVAEIREMAEKMITKVNGTRQKDMNEAWEEVMGSKSEFALFIKFEIPTPEIAETVKIMGWRNPLHDGNTAKQHIQGSISSRYL